MAAQDLTNRLNATALEHKPYGLVHHLHTVRDSSFSLHFLPPVGMVTVCVCVHALCAKGQELWAVNLVSVVKMDTNSQVFFFFFLSFLSFHVFLAHKYSQTPTHALMHTHYSHQAPPQPNCHCLHCSCYGNTCISGNPVNRMQ